MAALTTTSEVETYTQVSRLAAEYFRLLCAFNGVHVGESEDSGLDVDMYQGEDDTYTITVREVVPYRLMQRVFEAQNG